MWDNVMVYLETQGKEHKIIMEYDYKKRLLTKTIEDEFDVEVYKNCYYHIDESEWKQFLHKSKKNNDINVLSNFLSNDFFKIE